MKVRDMELTVRGCEKPCLSIKAMVAFQTDTLLKGVARHTDALFRKRIPGDMRSHVSAALGAYFPKLTFAASEIEVSEVDDEGIQHYAILDPLSQRIAQLVLDDILAMVEASDTALECEEIAFKDELEEGTDDGQEIR